MKSQKNNNGIWMLIGLVMLLGAPVAIGHYTMNTATAGTLHADAAN
jgi:hypothetical protein